MPESILKRLAALMSVKSVVTLVLTGVFAYLAVTGQNRPGLHDRLCGGHCLLFRDQSQKVQDVLTDRTDDSPTTITNYYQLPTEEGENVDEKMIFWRSPGRRLGPKNPRPKVIM